MATRYQDWFRQAKRDLNHAKHALEDGDYEWACFATQQAAEKSIKAVYQKIGADAWGHAVSILLANLPEGFRPEVSLIEEAKELDKFYIPPRYPNAHPSGIPSDYYTKQEAERAIDYAERILSFCEDKIF